MTNTWHAHNGMDLHCERRLSLFWRLLPPGLLCPLWWHFTSWCVVYCCCEGILESRSYRSGVSSHKWYLSYETWWVGRQANYKITVTWPLSPWALWWAHHVTMRSPWMCVKIHPCQCSGVNAILSALCFIIMHKKPGFYHLFWEKKGNLSPQTFYRSSNPRKEQTN